MILSLSQFNSTTQTQIIKMWKIAYHK